MGADSETMKAGMDLLAGWMDDTPRQFLPALARSNPRAVYKNKTARAAAISLVEDGITGQDMTAFIDDWIAKGEEGERGIDVLYFQIVANEITAWKHRRDNPPRPARRRGRDGDEWEAPYWKQAEPQLDWDEGVDFPRPTWCPDLLAEARAQNARKTQDDENRERAAMLEKRRSMMASIDHAEQELKERALASPHNGTGGACTCTAYGPDVNCPYHYRVKHD